jgi:hypothetical protein
MAVGCFKPESGQIDRQIDLSVERPEHCDGPASCKVWLGRALLRRNNQRSEGEAQTESAQAVKERKMNPIGSRRSVPKATPSSDCNVVCGNCGESYRRNGKGNDVQHLWPPFYDLSMLSASGSLVTRKLGLFAHSR